MYNDYIDVESRDKDMYYTNKKPSLWKRLHLGTVIGALVFGMTCSLGGGYIATKYYEESHPQTPVIHTQNTYIPTTNSSNSATLSYAEVAALTSDTVVEIQTETMTYSQFIGQYVSSGAGSGVVISSDGYIVTNNHVIEDATKITVQMRDGSEYPATLVGNDAKSDIAVLKVDAKNLQAAVFGNSDTLIVGEEVLAIGNPLGELGGSVTNGIISAKEREIEIDGQVMTLLQTNAAINPGNSGGGLFNMKGELIGVVNAKSSGTGIEGLGFAIPANDAKEVIEDIIEFGYVKGRVQLGISAIEISNATTAMRYGVNKLGVLVHSVTVSGSPLKSGDLIIQMEDTMITSMADLSKVLTQSKVGDKVEVVVIREGKEQKVSVTLTEYKPLNAQ